MTRKCIWIGVVAAIAGMLAAQTRKPNLSGHWVLDKTRSNLARMPAADSMTEVIDHQEPKIIITTSDGKTSNSIKLTTDGADNTNIINGNVFYNRSRWEDGKLITMVDGKGGLRLVEVRYLSADGKSQIVETYVGDNAGEPQQKRDMVKKK